MYFIAYDKTVLLFGWLVQWLGLLFYESFDDTFFIASIEIDA